MFDINEMLWTFVSYLTLFLVTILMMRAFFALYNKVREYLEFYKCFNHEVKWILFKHCEPVITSTEANKFKVTLYDSLESAMNDVPEQEKEDYKACMIGTQRNLIENISQHKVSTLSAFLKSTIKKPI